MNSLSSVQPNFGNYYGRTWNHPDNGYIGMPSYEGVPQEQNTAKTLVTASILQGIAMFLQKASQWCGNKLMRGKEFTSAENIYKTAQNMVNKNNLNVTVDFIDNRNINNYGGSIREALKPVARGENAFYTDELKLAVAPKSKPSLILHELGHAINAHKGKFLKFLQKSRGYVSAVPTVLLLLNGAIPKDKDNKKNFIERNAGLIGFASFLPTIVEEGLASIRGVKAAKETLGKAVNLAPLKRNYFFAWLTYLIAGIGLGVAAKQSLLSNKE